MLPEGPALPISFELQLEAAEARNLASLFMDEETIADLIAYASLLETESPQRR